MLFTIFGRSVLKIIFPRSHKQSPAFGLEKCLKFQYGKCGDEW